MKLQVGDRIFVNGKVRVIESVLSVGAHSNLISFHSDYYNGKAISLFTGKKHHVVTYKSIQPILNLELTDKNEPLSLFIKHLPSRIRVIVYTKMELKGNGAQRLIDIAKGGNMTKFRELISTINEVFKLNLKITLSHDVS